MSSCCTVNGAYVSTLDFGVDVYPPRGMDTAGAFELVAVTGEKDGMLLLASTDHRRRDALFVPRLSVASEI